MDLKIWLFSTTVTALHGLTHLSLGLLILQLSSKSQCRSVGCCQYVFKISMFNSGVGRHTCSLSSDDSLASQSVEDSRLTSRFSIALAHLEPGQRHYQKSIRYQGLVASRKAKKKVRKGP